MKREYVEEEKLYRIYYKRENHINQKVNDDGMIAAIQFTDAANALSGPIFMKAVDDEEIERDMSVDSVAEARSFKQIMWEEVIAPNLEYAIESILDVGIDRLSVWAAEVALPKAKKKSKELYRDAKIILSGVQDGIAGKETKASKLLKEIEKSSSHVDDIELSEGVSERECDLRTMEEVRQIIDAIRKSAMIIAAGIRLLSDTIIQDDGMNPKRRLEMQRNLKELSSEVILKQIDLLLENKNSDLLDEASLRMLSAFRECDFIVEGVRVPISNYLSVE